MFTSGLFSFLWHTIRKISIGNWLPFINLQMDTAHVYQNVSKTAWTQTKSENEMHAYWYNIETTIKVRYYCFWCKTLEKLRWKVKFLLKNTTPSLLVFQDPPPSPKSWIFQWTPKILNFFILNTVLSLKSNIS